MNYWQWLQFQSFARQVLEPTHKSQLEKLDEWIFEPYTKTVTNSMNAYSQTERWAANSMYGMHLTHAPRLALELLQHIGLFALGSAQEEGFTAEAKKLLWQETRRICTQLAPYLPEPDRAALLALLPVEDDEPVVSVSACDVPAMNPPPVSTPNIAHAFNGLHKWDEKAWKDNLGSPPKWLEACIVVRGQRGGIVHHWNPVLIGAALVRNGHAQTRSVRAKFQTSRLLANWLEAWITYEADNFDTE
jgi:hypothetical protein